MTTQTNANNKKGMDFFRGVRSELKKVNWPNSTEMKKYTAVVIFMVFLATVFVGGIDGIFKYLLNLALKFIV